MVLKLGIINGQNHCLDLIIGIIIVITLRMLYR
jgi:hypothetical protein